jgi:hypothetical protein
MTAKERAKAPAKKALTILQRSEALLSVIRQIWEAARAQAARSVNSALVQANWLIGKQIVQAEQGGESRAAYNRRLLKTLSSALQQEYGNGFSVSSLQYMRAFFLGYPHLLEIHHALRGESGRQQSSAKQHAVRVNSTETLETSEELRKELRREIQSLGEPKPERSFRRKT